MILAFTLITRRSVVRIRSPLLTRNQSTQYSGFLLAARTEVANILESEDLIMNHCSPGSKPAHTSIFSKAAGKLPAGMDGGAVA